VYGVTSYPDRTLFLGTGLIHELLAHHDDVHMQELVAVTVCERLGDGRELLQKARKFMGPRTRQFSKEVEDFWGRKR
jgi:hypothetical protein